MEYTSKFHFELPKGKAKRHFFEMNAEERIEIGKIAFQRAQVAASKIGEVPITLLTIQQAKSRRKGWSL